MIKNGYIDYLHKVIAAGGYQRTLHYHNTPHFHKKLYEEQMDFIQKNYVTYNLDDINNKLKYGEASILEKSEKKSIVIGFFDGYRNNFDVMYSILEERGLTAWYLLVADFLNTPVGEQEKMLEPYLMQYVLGEYEDGRYAMSWEEAKRAGASHVLVNHSSTHTFMKSETPKDKLEYEIYHSHQLIKENTGIEPKVFSWLGGADYETNPSASGMLRETRYQYLIGYRFENIEKQSDIDLVDMDRMSGEGSTMTVEEMQEEIKYHQNVMENIGIFSAVPAILPFCMVDHPIGNHGVAEDMELANDFRGLAMFLAETQNLHEWMAANKALDVLAVNRIGKGFPFHLN